LGKGICSSNQVVDRADKRIGALPKGREKAQRPHQGRTYIKHGGNRLGDSHPWKVPKGNTK